MDLTQFFGEWDKGTHLQITETSEGQERRRYWARVEVASGNQITITHMDTKNPFYLDVACDKMDGSSVYSFSLNPGPGIVPSYYSGSNLPGTIVIGPPPPSILFLQGPMTFSSNTLITQIYGRISFQRDFKNSKESEIEVQSIHPRMSPVNFKLMAVEPVKEV
jgi:hypothetical protein